MRINGMTKYLNWAPLLLGACFIPLLNTKYMYDHFSVIKWFAVHALAAICILHLFTYKKFPRPNLPSWVWSALGLCAVIFVMHLALGHTSLINFPLTDRLSLVVLCYYFFTFFKQNKVDFKPLFYGTLPATVIVVLYGLYQIATMTTPTADFSSTFGNTNMTAQFLGFSILIQLFAMPWKEKKHSKFNYLRMFILFISVVYLTLLMCRSVSLGLALCMPFLFFKNRPARSIALCALAVFAVSVGVFLRAKPAETLQRTKQFELKNDTTNQRLVMWKQSLRLLQDHPLGLGPAAYEFGSIHYMINTDMPPREDLVYKSPHNEFLRFAVEDGIPFLLLMAAVWGWLLWTRLQKPWTAESVFFAVFALLWLTEMTFQFPFENAYPSFLFSAMVGQALALRGTNKNFPSLPLEITSAVILVVLLFISGRMIYGKYLEATANGVTAINKASCEAFQENWRACMSYSKDLIEQKKYEEADEVLRSLLERAPYNFAALKAWGIMALGTRHPQQGCAALWIYDQIFSSNSSVKPTVTQYCAAYAKQFSDIGLYQLYPKPLPKLSF